MPLSFPNAARSYDRRKQCVSFWAHDSTLEITFDVEAEALHAICHDDQRTEESLLETFDNNRARIEQLASRAYARHRAAYLRLTTKDF